MFGDIGRTPRSLLVCERSTFLHEKNRLSQQVEQQHFNYKVSLLLPGCSSVPRSLDDVLKSFSSFYLLKNLPVHELLDKGFLESAVYQGRVYGLSYRTRLDEDNCIALMPNGRLCLSLDKDSFEMLGVEGKPSRFNFRTKCRYVISVDLTDSRMAPGGWGYERLLTGLKSRLQLRTDFLLAHHPGGEASVQALLSRCVWTERRPEISRRTLTQLSCPILSPDQQSCDPHSFLEWLGAVDAGISCENSADSFVSSLVCPEPNITLSKALSVSVSGLLLPHHIYQLVQQIRNDLAQPGHRSWAALTVHGFADSPVSWGGSEHGVLMGGENFYSLLIFRGHTYQLHMATGAHDTCPQ